MDFPQEEPSILEKKARVLSVNRKKVELLLEDNSIQFGTLASKALDACVGDFVRYEPRGENLLVTGTEQASKVITRTHWGKVFRVGANIDRIFLVTALGDVFNLRAIDRVLIAAYTSSIPVTVLFNKSDLGREAFDLPKELYSSLGFDTELCSALDGTGVKEIEERILQPELRTVAFVGVSGVGKSSLIKKVLLRDDIKTGDVSERTGQGKQTTSQSRAYVRADEKIVIDFPGVQLFGLSHVTHEQLLFSYPEFSTFRQYCRFSNCSHIKEEECGVKGALEKNQIAPWRYLSYLEIYHEIEDAKPY